MRLGQARRMRLARGCPAEGHPERLTHVLDPDELEHRAGALRNVFQVASIAGWKNDAFDARTCGCDRLFLDPADRQHETPEADLARHGYIRPYRLAPEQRSERYEHRHPRTWSVLRDRPRGHVHVDVTVLEQPGVDAKLESLTLEQAHCRLRALLHDISELPCEDELATARQPG